MEKHHKRSSFSGTIGFVMAAAGSSVGLGNIWRFPYLAAKDGGGVFLLCYIVLALTFGFTLLTTEIAIGRKTAQSPLTAYGKMKKGWNWLGVLACLVPLIILPYYCTIGGWVLKYFFTYMTGGGSATVGDSYFTGFISAQGEPVLWFIVFLAVTTMIVYKGVNHGIEKYSKVLMPILLVLIIGTSLFSLTLKHTDGNGMVRTGLQGLAIYVIPDFTGMTLPKFLTILTDAMGQLFYSISVAMGIMVAYGSYVKKDANLSKAVNQIEFFDTLVAFLAGMMIIPAVYTFMGTEGMSAGPGLMFVSLPKIFAAMGKFGMIIGWGFFLMVFFAAVTSSVSVMEAVVSSVMDKFHMVRQKATLTVGAITLIVGVVVCLGYNLLYFEAALPNGTVGQILDVMDYLSNSFLMPIVSIATCILAGWVVGPGVIIEEVTISGCKFGRKKLYVLMVRYIAPVLLFILLMQSLGIIREPATTAETSETAVILTSAPKLTLQDSLSSTLNEFELQSGSYSWNYMEGNTIQSLVACGMHPLDTNLEKAEKLAIPNYNKIDSVPYLVTCAVLPDRLTVKSWDAAQLGNTEAEEASSVTYENSQIIELKPDTVYEITAVWDEDGVDTNGFYGDASYAFITE